MNPNILFFILLLLAIPLAYYILTNFYKYLKSLKIHFWFIIIGSATLVYYVFFYRSGFDFDTFFNRPPKMIYREKLRLENDPYKNITSLKSKNQLYFSNKIDLSQLRLELSNVIPTVIDAYKTVVGEKYTPAILAVKDLRKGTDENHFQNYSLEWSVSDIKRNQAHKIKRLLRSELGSVSQYEVDLLMLESNLVLQVRYKNIVAKDRYEDYIIDAAKKHELDVALVMSVIHRESMFKVNAKHSRSGASGLMQLMPGTAGDMGVKRIFHPVDNIDGGAKYLKKMLNRYRGNTELALAAYNSGFGNIDKAISRAKSHRWAIVKHNLVTSPNSQNETKNYVRSIMSYYKVYQEIYRGF